MARIVIITVSGVDHNGEIIASQIRVVGDDPDPDVDVTAE